MGIVSQLTTFHSHCDKSGNQPTNSWVWANWHCIFVIHSNKLSSIFPVLNCVHCFFLCIVTFISWFSESLLTLYFSALLMCLDLGSWWCLVSVFCAVTYCTEFFDCYLLLLDNSNIEQMVQPALERLDPDASACYYVVCYSLYNVMLCIVFVELCEHAHSRFLFPVCYWQ